MSAAASATLTIDDMCKAIDRGMAIVELRLVETRVMSTAAILLVSGSTISLRTSRNKAASATDGCSPRAAARPRAGG